MSLKVPGNGTPSRKKARVESQPPLRLTHAQPTEHHHHLRSHYAQIGMSCSPNSSVYHHSTSGPYNHSYSSVNHNNMFYAHHQTTAKVSSNCINHGNVARNARMPKPATLPPAFDMGKGEGVMTRRQQQQRELELQAWRAEMEASVAKESAAELRSTTNHREVRSSPPAGTEVVPTFRLVLAKKGLLVKQSLGSGSYSKVKLAESVEDHVEGQMYPSQVAVKIIDRNKAPRDFQEKFLPRELDVWPKLSHPSIVSMLNVFHEKHRVYMVLEYCPGGDALKFIQSNGAVAETTGKIWVSQVTDAVVYLHNKDITHRDLKLENMLIDAYNNIKLCDFGFVKSSSSYELSKTYCGSKSYAAPEILQGEPYDPKKADVWAIGVILFILVTGKMPFDETKGNQSLLEEHRVLNLAWPRDRRRSITTSCKELASYCLQFVWQTRPSVHHVLHHAWFKKK